ncbi:porphobilinogen synthase [bacterium]|nr:porphobilinogen synthase [bacterium]
MNFPVYRPRRMRATENLRRMVRETRLSVDQLVLPLFVIHGKGIKKEIPSMPGNYHFSPDTLTEEAQEAYSLGIPAVILFGLPAQKDKNGSEAYSEDGIVQQAIRQIKSASPDLIVITDVCLCEYTSHGHCGLLTESGRVDNDATLEVLARSALSHCQAGADMVAPSDMMDGRIHTIRSVLDKNGYSHIPIMSYAAKYASSFYGPFRDAADSTPQFGDRRGYQMDPPNAREAVRECRMDIQEGADIIMVKPALPYLDIIWQAKTSLGYPVAAYNVSGEFSMIKAAAEKGWIDEKRAMMEALTSISRAGADIIITYFAKDAARHLNRL